MSGAGEPEQYIYRFFVYSYVNEPLGSLGILLVAPSPHISPAGFIVGDSHTHVDVTVLSTLCWPLIALMPMDRFRSGQTEQLPSDCRG